MNLDVYYDKVYNESKYNCAHFVCEVWEKLTGFDVSWALAGAMTGQTDRRLDAHRLLSLKRLEAPESPCIALFQAGRRAPHVGIFLEDKILHITKDGVNWSSVENVMLCFNRVRFYNVKKDNNCRKLARTGNLENI